MRSIWGVPWRCFSSLVPKSRPPTWWQQGWPRQRAGSVAEAELLAPLGELLMPCTPVRELFRSFKSPPGWGGHYLEPDLTAYGVLKDKTAALFVEYDGYYRHGTKEGVAMDHLKNMALLAFAPQGSCVVRINHENRCQMEANVLWVSVNRWRQRDHKSLARALVRVAEQMVCQMEHAMDSKVSHHLLRQVQNESMLTPKFNAVSLISHGSTAEEIHEFLSAKGFEPMDISLMQTAVFPGVSIEKILKPKLQFFLDLGLTRRQIAKAVATHPRVLLGLGIEQNLKPTVQWFLDLGLTQSQVAKAVATHPKILSLNIEKNLKPTVKWFLDLGLRKWHVAKAVATYPQLLGLSIEQNLKPTVQLFLNLGMTESQVVSAVAKFPPILWYSVEQNLKPTIRWLLDLGLTQEQIPKALSSHPQILGLSIFQNLEPKVQWLLDLGLSKSEVTGAVVDFPQILDLSIDKNLALKFELLLSFYTPPDAVNLIAKWPRVFFNSHERLERRLHVLAEQNRLEKLRYALSLNEETFHQRFLAGKKMLNVLVHNGMLAFFFHKVGCHSNWKL